MSTRHLSVRVDTGTFNRLDKQSRQAGMSRSELAKTLLEEGLRMQAHPGIVFRPGPAGRRPGITDGPDVWEVVRVFQGSESTGESAVREVADLTGIAPDRARMALRYYIDFPEEIDEWIRRVDEEAERLEDAWRREQDLLRH